VIELLLELGVTSPEAESAVRDAFIQTASHAVENETGRTSASLIALRSGLYRSEIKRRQVSTLPSGYPDVEPHRLSRLLRGWHNDPEFTTPAGSPRDLPQRGRKSFETLVKRYAANLYPAIVLDELQRVAAVSRLSDGRLRVLQSDYRVSDANGARIREIGSRAAEILRALVRGVQQPDVDHLLAVAEGTNLDPRFLPLLRKTVSARVAAFVSLLDEQLNDEAMQMKDGGESLSVTVIGTLGFGLAPERARSSGLGPKLESSKRSATSAATPRARGKKSKKALRSHDG
jgi:hypothetical protein